MVCPVSLVNQFSSYAFCSPNMWMIIGCTVMNLLTMLLVFYLHHGFRRDGRWLQFAQWKLQQLAERLRIQEPNVTLVEKITRKVNEKNHLDDGTFKDFFHTNHPKMLTSSSEAAAAAALANGKNGDNPPDNTASDGVAARVQRAREKDAEKVLRDTNIDGGINTPHQPTPPDASKKSGRGGKGNESILKKWTDATKDILAINDDADQNNNQGVDATQDENMY